MQKKKEIALIFVEHIEKHLKEMFPKDANVKIKCKICGKTIFEIYREKEG